MSNNPDKAAQLDRLGVTVSERVPTALHLSGANEHYLTAKARRGAHSLDLSQLLGGVAMTASGGHPESPAVT